MEKEKQRYPITGQLGLHLATVSQKVEYSRHSESEKGERHAKDVGGSKWGGPRVSFRIMISWYLK